MITDAPPQRVLRRGRPAAPEDLTRPADRVRLQTIRLIDRLAPKRQGGGR
jgi:hypothetical protein